MGNTCTRTWPRNCELHNCVQRNRFKKVGIDRRTAAAVHFRRLGFKGTPGVMSQSGKTITHKGATTLNRLIRSQVGRTNFEDISLSNMGQPYGIEIQDVFELEGRKIFLHFTVIFDVTLEGMISGDDTWGWRSVSPPWVTMIPKALPVQIAAGLPAYFSGTAVYNLANEDVETPEIEANF